MSANPTRRKTLGGLKLAFITLLIVCIALILFVFHIREETRESQLLEPAQSIGLLLYQYADDHHGQYPEGNSSTEVFQKLIDGGYVSDPDNQEEASGPEIFYFPMPGKTKPASKTLKPENVCWDITCGLKEFFPDQIPVVYVTGFRVVYHAGSRAVPENWPPRTWWEWLTDCDYPRKFMVVNYMSHSSIILKAAPSGAITNFIPANASGVDAIYRQLTPDGHSP